VHWNGFDFEFDRSKPLGMICPTILEPPYVHAKDGCTVFVLELRDDAMDVVIEGIIKFNPEVLLFTRRLRFFNAYVCDDFRFSKSCSITPEGVATISTCEETTMKEHYIRHTHTFRRMPLHPKRDSSVTETVLAFPYRPFKGPIIENWNMFAFLPIRETRFSGSAFSSLLTNSS
jgi:hypothetical protein